MSDQSVAPAPNTAPRRSAKLLLGVLVLAAALAAGLYWWLPGRSANRPASDVAPAVSNTPANGLNAELEALRSRLDDAAQVNRALREQVLGLTERVGLVEDGLSGMERGAAPGVDALRLAEADFLLQLGGERLRAFQDVAGARTAFALADSQLSEVSDPRATSVRQTLALERDALAAVASADLPVLLGRIDGLARASANWPMRSMNAPGDADVAAEPRWYTRLGLVVDRYFRVRRVDPQERSEGGPLLRERLALDLSRARLLLLRGEGKAALNVLEGVRDSVRSRFDATDSQVTQALQILDEIVAAPLAPALPNLGDSQRELARLRGVPDKIGIDRPDAAVDASSAAPAPDTLPEAADPVDASVPVAPGATAADTTAAPQAQSTPADASQAEAMPTDAGSAPGPGDDAAPVDADRDGDGRN